MSKREAREMSFTAGDYTREKACDLARSNMGGVDEKLQNRICLVIDELCSNALKHGSGAGDEITLGFDRNEDMIEIQVKDKGRGTSAKKAAEIDREVTEKRALCRQGQVLRNCWGLSNIVAGWMDELKFEDMPGGGIRVRVIKYL